MENLELNKQEKKELERRGFFVKELLWINWFLKSYSFNIFISLLFGLAGSLFISFIWSYLPAVIQSILQYGIFLFLSILIWISSYNYIFLGKLFFTKNIIFAFQNKYENIDQINPIKWIFLFQTSKKDNSKIEILIFLSLIPIIWIVGTIMSIWLWTSIILPYLIVYWIPILLFVFRQLVEHFHPLYAFGNLWDKIQKITPRIEEQSKQIQSEFQSDMNFSILSNWFDSLSTTFTNIVSLVIKLEKVETRANKGNLFDSEKYINSLRSDIVTPLTSLKAFLEKQKSELMQSQQELTRVRVWGNESSGNIELQSKRSESLIQELTENIEKLDMMIGKMGEIVQILT